MNAFTHLLNCVKCEVQQERSSSVGLGESWSLTGDPTHAGKFPPSLYSLPAGWPQLWRGMVLPYGAVHPGHCEEGSEVGRVGGAHDQGEEPPAAHHDAHGHGVHGGLATCGRGGAEGLAVAAAPTRPWTCSGQGASTVRLGTREVAASLAGATVPVRERP